MHFPVSCKIDNKVDYLAVGIVKSPKQKENTNICAEKGSESKHAANLVIYAGSKKVMWPIGLGVKSGHGQPGSVVKGETNARIIKRSLLSSSRNLSSCILSQICPLR